jgi:hypothetical protein
VKTNLIKTKPRKAKSRLAMRKKSGPTSIVPWHDVHSRSWLDSVKIVAASSSSSSGVLTSATPVPNNSSLLSVSGSVYYHHNGTTGSTTVSATISISITLPSIGAIIDKLKSWWKSIFGADYPLTPKDIPAGALRGFPMISNVQGIWHFASARPKVAPDGGAYSAVTLYNLYGYKASLGIMKVRTGDYAGFAAYVTPQGARVTNLLKLPKADSYCLEADVDQKTGQTTFWVNDSGWDMGVLQGFKGGAHFAGFSSGAIGAGTHLLSGRFANCAVAREGKWDAAPLSRDTLMGEVPPHIEVTHSAPASMTIADLRSKVV